MGVERVIEQPRVLVIGDVIDDIVVRPQQPIRRGSDTVSFIDTSPGGSGANQAVWLADQGCQVRFIGRVGQRDFARHTRDLQHHGVDARLARDRTTATGRIVVLVEPDDQERTMFTDRGANHNLGTADIPDDVLDDITHIHASGYSLFNPAVRTVVLDVVEEASRAGLTVSFDPSSVTFLNDVGADTFVSWVSGSDLLFPNLDEGRVLSGRDAPLAIVDYLRAYAGAVVLKLGPNGLLVADASTPATLIEALPAEVVDTTGAGDAVCAAVLTAWLHGATLIEAAHRGVAAAARAVSIAGARPQPRGGDRGAEEPQSGPNTNSA